MITLKRILCPVDFSEYSSRSFGLASSLAKWYGARIELLHVDNAPAAGRDPERLGEIAELARSSGVHVDEVVLQGDPSSRILERLRECRADLLVLGTHGRGGFQRWALGSVAEKVLRNTGCPVLTVPPRLASRSDHEGRVFQRILCPVDFSEASLAALEFALSLAKESDADFTLFHSTEAMTEEDVPELLHFDISRFRRDLETAAATRLASLVPVGARDWCSPETVVTSGKAYREILRVAQGRQSDLIVMGTHGRRPFAVELFGSTAQQVIRRAECPVLTLGSLRQESDRD
jgi:nucleotide-binding universal stress UspA family protein